MTSKMLPCHACCPKREGYPTGKARHEYDVMTWGDSEAGTETVWTWRCDNCGNFKKPRISKKRRDFDYVAEEAISDEGMNLRNRARFHYFNPNGAYAALKAMHGRLDDWLNANPDAPNGVLLVHGSLSTYPYKFLSDVLDAKNPKGWDVDYAIRKMYEAVKDGDAWIAEKSA